MSESLYTELQWLPRPPEDFAKRCRALREAAGDGGREVRALASFGLDENKLARLANAIEAVRGRPDALRSLTPFRLGILSNAFILLRLNPEIQVVSLGFVIVLAALFDQWRMRRSGS